MTLSRLAYESRIKLVASPNYHIQTVELDRAFAAYRVHYRNVVTGDEHHTLLREELVRVFGEEFEVRIDLDGNPYLRPYHKPEPVPDEKSPAPPATISDEKVEEVRRALIELLEEVYQEGYDSGCNPSSGSLREYSEDMTDTFMKDVYEQILSDPHREEDLVVDSTFDPRPGSLKYRCHDPEVHRLPLLRRPAMFVVKLDEV